MKKQTKNDFFQTTICKILRIHKYNQVFIVENTFILQM
jgi:hypothetical protein